MTSIMEIMQNMLASYQQDLHDLLQPQADYTKVNYLPQRDEKFGLYDGNFTNRFRIFTAIRFLQENPCAACVDLTRHLLAEEIKDRESNSFQGIGNLELIVWLLRNDVQDTDLALFQRAKDANFDTACGFNADDALEDDYFIDDLANLDLEECIDLALSLQEFSYAETLIELWIKTQKEWNQRNLSSLKYWSRRAKNHTRELHALEKLSALSLAAHGAKEICSDLQLLCRKQIELNLTQQSSQTLLLMRKYLPQVSGWNTIGLGRFIIEDSMDVIIGLDDEEQRRALWAWAGPYLSTMKNMHGNLYQKGAAAAKIMGDLGLADQLTATWSKKGKLC